MRTPSPRPRVMAALWLISAAAAALLLVGGALDGMQLLRSGGEPTYSQAARDSSRPGTAEVIVERPSAASGERPRAPDSAPVDPLPQDVVATPADPVAQGSHERSSAPSRAARLAELDAAAGEAWRAGDLGEAERLYRRLVDVGGRDALVDLAYGDLFTLAQRRNAPTELTRLWGTYLKRFPRGRFSDDARAGLCRTAAVTEATACWAAYLADFPGGAHVTGAKRALNNG